MSLLVFVLVLALNFVALAVITQKFGEEDIRANIGFYLMIFLDGVVVFCWGVFAWSHDMTYPIKGGASYINGADLMGIGVIVMVCMGVGAGKETIKFKNGV